MLPDARLETILLALMVIQPVLGLAFQGQYRDVDWIRATWYGNDWVTLVVAVPLFLFGSTEASHGRARGILLRLGVVGYAAYNYAFYLLGAAINPFFPLYVTLVVVPASILIVQLPALNTVELTARFSPVVPARLIAACFMCLAVGLSSVWILMWAAYVFFGRPTPVEPDAFRLVAALDLSVMVPLLMSGAALLWRDRARSVVICAMAGVQASIYLLVLSVNAMVAVRRGFAAWPGEIPLWTVLLLVTTAATVALLMSIRDGD